MTNTRKRSYGTPPKIPRSKTLQPAVENAHQLIIDIDSSESSSNSPNRTENGRDDASEIPVGTAVINPSGSLSNAFDDENGILPDVHEQNIPQNEIKNEIRSSIPSDDLIVAHPELYIEESHENAEQCEEHFEESFEEHSEDFIEQLIESQEQSTESQEHSSHSAISQSYISPPRIIRQSSDTPDFDQISRRMTANKAKYLKSEETFYLNACLGHAKSTSTSTSSSSSSSSMSPPPCSQDSTTSTVDGDGNESHLSWIAVRCSLNYLEKLKERRTEERKTLEFNKNIKNLIESRLPTDATEFLR